MMNKSQELQQLTDHVEDLLGKVADDQSPHLQNLRTRVNQTIQSAKTAISRADTVALDALKNAANSADDYVRENPWVAIGVIAGVAASLGYLAGYMTAPRKSFMGMIRR
ncbi:MAG: hypothetical protein QOD95_1300 [Gammaproteobacteria bacterium]|jgi:ElaB/YqjD/DUF883 family membrane-anchored ribosome-binding protein|nr:hypothetical protein [Gammaproteobacteria bacterium]